MFSVSPTGAVTEVSFVTYDYVAGQITFDNSDISLIGKTVEFQNRLYNQYGNFFDKDLYTIAFTGPANAECYTTVFEPYPASFDTISHVFGEAPTVSSAFPAIRD